MIIDFHTHVFPPRIKEDHSRYCQSDPAFATLYANPNSKAATADELIASMDRDGIDMAVIAIYGWTNQELCVETNDYILESIARYPERLIGFCSVLPESGSALKEIERCVRGGVRGVGELRPDIQFTDIKNERITKPLVELMKKHKLILLTHASEPVGHTYQGKGAVTPGLLYPFITAYPDLTIVCAHWGGGLPFYALMPEVKQAMSNVYFDTAASPFLYTPRIYSQVIELVGADKILFGSDYPLIPHRRYLKEISSLDLPEETKGLILGGNAQKLLDIKNK
ncbi:MAG: amidohydrolase family protein [Dehalococcoidales bacterium]|nr:amidohydrolase family protein [Dehalococcoidales bacterium]